MAVLAALNSSPIHRLKRTKELLSTRSCAVFEDLKATMDPAQNFNNYRGRLRSINNDPSVPFLGRSLVARFDLVSFPSPFLSIPLPVQASFSLISRSSRTGTPTPSRIDPISSTLISDPRRPRRSARSRTTSDPATDYRRSRNYRISFGSTWREAREMRKRSTNVVSPSNRENGKMRRWPASYTRVVLFEVAPSIQ